MDETKNQAGQEPNENPEADQEALQEVKEDALRAEIVEALGVADIDDNAEFIDKALAREKDHRQKLATAIKQKINWREKAKKPITPAPEPKPANQENKPIAADEVQRLVDERLDEEKLSELGLDDSILSELKAYAKSKGITARQALKSDYFNFLKESKEKAQKDEEASATRSSKGSPAKKNFDPEKPPQIDPNDPKSLERYEEWYAQVSK